MTLNDWVNYYELCEQADREHYARPLPPPEDNLMTPAEVAHAFRVDPKTVTRWAKIGRLSSIRTLGGHRRFRQSEVARLLVPTNTPANA